MLKINSIILLVFTLLHLQNINAQNKKYDVNGYVTNLQSVQFTNINNNYITDNLLHNRLNFNYFPNARFTGNFELRNRFRYGEVVSSNPTQAATQYSSNTNFINLSTNLATGKSYVLNSNFDRAYLTYEYNKVKITLGRQRINWSQTWVWNPNDVFNTYSFFDFDYVERSGADALRLQYYNTEVSTTEMAFKLNHQRQLTAAAYYKFNYHQCDIQTLAGLLNSTNYFCGAGFAGAIKTIGIKAEVTLMKPLNIISDTTTIILSSVAANYTFANQLTLVAEFFYTNHTTFNISSFEQFYTSPLSVKNLSFVKYNVYAQAMYPINALLNTSVALMYLPTIKGFYAGPLLSYSLSNNFYITCHWQTFRAQLPHNIGNRYNMVFLRLKFNF